MTAAGRRPAATTATLTVAHPSLTGGGRRRRAVAAALTETLTVRAAPPAPTAGARRRVQDGLMTEGRRGRSGGRQTALTSGGRRQGRPSVARRRPSGTSLPRGAIARHLAAGALCGGAVAG